MGDNRLTRITTRTGDDGMTGLANGTRLAKTHPRVIAIGEVDELNAALGMLAVSPGLAPSLAARLRDAQHRLFELGGELALPGREILDRQALAELEADITAWNASLPPLTEFVLPGGCEASARAHLARAVCRRAERALWLLHAQEPAVTQDAAARFLNRLSDWLFVASRLLAHESGTDAMEPLWRGIEPL
ncbi:MAG: cob(I)yrinic acid a,c-diamide adenosyltransferase [Gammaproteobacteria bacterium]